MDRLKLTALPKAEGLLQFLLDGYSGKRFSDGL
jgi:hypothetical protein